MRDTGFAFANGALGAMENTLLTPAFFDQLIQSSSYGEALGLLADKGFSAFEHGKNPDDALDCYAQEGYEMLREISPDAHIFDFILVKNDFHNLKAALKSLVLGKEECTFFRRPCLAEPEEMFALVREKRFSLLPDFLAESAEEGYERITAFMDGQQLDLYLDSAALAAALAMAKKTDCGFAVRLAETEAALCDIKIALRLARRGAPDALLDAAFCENALIDVPSLKKAVRSGEDEVLEWLLKTPFAPLAIARKEGVVAFEKAFDDRLLSLLSEARMCAFGPEGLLAFYKMREMEEKNLRIVLSCKKIGMAQDKIKKMLRDEYV